jgi:hypothetical protein
MEECKMSYYYTEMGIFEDYMGVQYREGMEARDNGLGLDCNPYDKDTEMGKAWIDEWNKTDE